ncbi:heterokaryon incompatibility protein-domain-containing protein [Podospora aff. communis PSN243]|uniref:Heterokaryon incompatibility protein-domain-containing protein n=1 Tax=Podospora aff. communis PSN243 TaxID=3040156 RepID=A0AAV9GCV1_9PEZI|nr:heterokaryon incompatibility protein-domain-containing protein [Podospora aff. communis PSN243]
MESHDSDDDWGDAFEDDDFTSPFAHFEEFEQPRSPTVKETHTRIIDPPPIWTYKPLGRQHETAEVRLLVVEPPIPDRESEVHGELLHYDLWSPLRSTEFEAISYTWRRYDIRRCDETWRCEATWQCGGICRCGNKDINLDTPVPKDEIIFLGNSVLPVTANCVAALKRVRFISKPRVVWIDAVCINQNDLDERGHQVRLMAEIYTKAKRVLVYPGEPEDESHIGLHTISTASMLNFHGSLPYGHVRKALVSLIRQPYFYRVWILQELALAREAVVLYGEHDIKWDFLRCQIRDTLPSHTTASITRILALRRNSPGLLPLLDAARDCRATDPRDKVFALYGMIEVAHRLGYVANYQESVEDTYIRTALDLIPEYGLLPVLARALSWPGSKMAGLPLWAPDWTIPCFPDILTHVSQVDQGPSHDILVDRSQSWFEANGARVCDLHTLWLAGFSPYLFTPELHGQWDSAKDYPAYDPQSSYNKMVCYTLLRSENPRIYDVAKEAELGHPRTQSSSPSTLLNTATEVDYHSTTPSSPSTLFNTAALEDERKHIFVLSNNGPWATFDFAGLCVHVREWSRSTQDTARHRYLSDVFDVMAKDLMDMWIAKARQELQSRPQLLTLASSEPRPLEAVETLCHHSMRTWRRIWERKQRTSNPRGLGWTADILSITWARNVVKLLKAVVDIVEIWEYQLPEELAIGLADINDEALLCEFKRCLEDEVGRMLQENQVVRVPWAGLPDGSLGVGALAFERLRFTRKSLKAEWEEERRQQEQEEILEQPRKDKGEHEQREEEEGTTGKNTKLKRPEGKNAELKNTEPKRADPERVEGESTEGIRIEEDTTQGETVQQERGEETKKQRSRDFFREIRRMLM